MERATMWARVDRRRRACGFDRNDLRRDVDRAQWGLGLVLLILFLGVATPLGVHVARTVHASAVREAAAWHRVDATVVKTAESRGRHKITVTWTEPGGTRRTGDYTTWRGPRAGSRVTLWADSRSVSDVPPPRHSAAITRAAVAAAGAVLAAGLPPLGLYRLVRHRCDRRRDRSWDAAWARLDNHRIGP
jgi:hypothetical protein